MKWILSTLLAVSLFSIKSQSQSVRILFYPSNPYFYNTDQAWKFSLLNASGRSMNAWVEVAIFKGGSFQLYRAQTAPFTLLPGENAAQVFASRIISTEYASDEAATFFKNTSLLPAGNYSLCVWIKSIQNGVVSNACEEVEVKSITLPILTKPYNKEVIHTILPLLTWIPVMPQGIPQLQYVLDLWESGSGRTTSSGTIASLKTEGNSYQYNSSLKQLSVGKTYTWQVSAFAGDYYLGKSQTWEFTIKRDESSSKTRDGEDSLEEEILPDSYRVIGDETIGADYTAVGILRIAYNNVAMDSTLSYKVSLEDMPEQYLNGLPVAALLSGFNKIDIDLSGTGLFVNNQEYTLEIVDGNQRSYYLNFLYVNP